CRTLELADADHGSSTNCVGIDGSDNLEVNSPSTLSLTYRDGNPCFSGTIQASGWGAVYIFGLAPGSGSWDATSEGVTGFEFSYLSNVGNTPPASLKVIYKDSGGTDYCDFIAPGTTALPFTSTSNCTAYPGTGVDPTDLIEMILAFTPGNNNPPYALDFCVQITALE
ncbi:MAG TPA: hypothetical protein VJU61_10240, partial [Polyangiaceae bacterium]|nr:hypothetical protein [Polyangiaceae bacterium]